MRWWCSQREDEDRKWLETAAAAVEKIEDGGVTAA